jgi:anaerobic magnesium-protoporphyrin IX monomethyl ester cyclase
MKSDQIKLLLIMPPQPGLLSGFANGLISLANYVAIKMPEINTNILDLSRHSYNEVRKELVGSYKDLRNMRLFVGITTSTASYQSALFVARMVRDLAPQAIIVLGGHHASSDPETILRNHSEIVDLVIIGEGERALCELARHYPSLQEVPGVAFLNEGIFKLTAPPSFLSSDELDSIPITYGDNGLIGIPGKFDHVTYVSARGCPLGCSFCAVGNDQIRTKSISAVIRDIELLLDMGFSHIAIEDNFFAHSPVRTIEICKALAAIRHRRNSSFAWDCQTRVESLARDNTISLMAEGGCEAVYIGVESINPDQLIYLNKTQNTSNYLRLLVDKVIPGLLETNVNCFLNLQFGLPGETVKHDR